MVEGTIFQPNYVISCLCRQVVLRLKAEDACGAAFLGRPDECNPNFTFTKLIPRKNKKIRYEKKNFEKIMYSSRKSEMIGKRLQKIA